MCSLSFWRLRLKALIFSRPRLDNVASGVHTRDMTQTLHLQGIGKCSAKAAGDVRVGDTLTWNYGYQYEVVAVEPCGKQSVRVTERSKDNGKEYTRTMRKTRLVVA